MTTPGLNRILGPLRAVALAQDGHGLTDGELLERYVNRRDEAAFTALVRRHGPMVLGVCRRVLRHEADAEDAFQATFLVLVRKAGCLRDRGLVGNWLYGVAHNTALKAKAMNRKRRTKELEAAAMPKREAVEQVWEQLQALLDAELNRLPDQYRAPIVLCELEGKTIKEAARHLGWPQGTVATRLFRGRARLARRLARHGLAMSPGALAAALSNGSAAVAVPPNLVQATIESARVFAAGGALSSKVVGLTNWVVNGMFLTKLKAVTVSLVTVALLGGVGLVSYGAAGAGPTGDTEARSRATDYQATEGRADTDVPQSELGLDDIRRRHEALLAARDALRRDPSLVVYYTFEPEQEQDGTLRNQAAGRTPATDGAIFGCSWADGRWPGTRALQFKRIRDRVRLHVPGEFESVTLMAWVRVDGLPNQNNALLLADGWPPGAVHWQIGEGGKLVFAVKPPSAKPHPGPPPPPPAGVLAKLKVALVQMPPREAPAKRAPTVKPQVGAAEGQFHAPDVFGPERFGTWIQLAAVFDRESRQVAHYVDGRPVVRMSVPFDVPLRVGDAEIGNWRPAGNPSPAIRYLDGCIDEFLLFSRALADEEIGRLYALGRPPS
ncbi:MAG TPA: sigma-70 family RNA polymerase sigma factor [Gemmataceae bacterium]|nr:sigma-70 family RNA polymerase sigma factor [Gemmataceae bacterium]